MDGFKVDTIELAESSAGYYSVSNALADDLEKLIKIKEILTGLTVGEDVFNLLNSATTSLSRAVGETITQGDKCRKIAKVYEKTENDVDGLVKVLPVTLPFGRENENPIFVAGLQALNHKVKYSPAQINVKTEYVPTKPVLISTGRLPSESWLLGLAVNAIAEGEWQWK